MGRRRRPAAVHGLLVIDKPAGVTSHDVVDEVRRRFGERQVGHAGTLDPSATGVLLVGVGKVTRLLRFVSPLGKSYQADIRFGVETSTLDADGEVTATHDMVLPPVEEIQDMISEHLQGDITQVPPMVSAVRVGGQRLHELARQGIEVDRVARPVTVHRFVVAPTDDPLVLRAQVTCSSGTYVRTLAADLGHLLGGGAHLASLRRIAVGAFTEAEAEPVETARLLAPAEALRGMSIAEVDRSTASLVRNGQVLAAFPGVGPWAVVDDDGELLAVYEPHRNGAKPVVVVAAPVA
jgi:tRNA pseudouridine55 synthase